MPQEHLLLESRISAADCVVTFFGARQCDVVRDAHLAQELGRLVQGEGPRAAAVQVDRLADLQADGQRGIERAHRLLKDHGDAVAADGADAEAQPQGGRDHEGKGANEGQGFHVKKINRVKN